MQPILEPQKALYYSFHICASRKVVELPFKHSIYILGCSRWCHAPLQLVLPKNTEEEGGVGEQGQEQHAKHVVQGFQEKKSIIIIIHLCSLALSLSILRCASTTGNEDKNVKSSVILLISATRYSSIHFKLS